MALVERVMSSWGYVGKIVCNLGGRSRPAPAHGLCDVKGLQIPGGRLLWRRASRKRCWQERVRCIAQPVVEKVDDVVPKAEELTVYKDSRLEVMAIKFLTNQMGQLAGETTDIRGYNGFVDMSRKLVHGLPAKKQQGVIRDLLHIVVPAWVRFIFRSIPRTMAVKEFYARSTAVFFRWLVGNCEVREKEIDGVLLKSTVYIKKCRYLENSKCVGLCVNLCKNPTEEFIGKQFGMPLTMNPNFEDMSCEMIYGLKPPPTDKDAAYKHPCYSLCKTARAKPNCA